MPPTITKTYPPIPLAQLVKGIAGFSSLTLESKKAFIYQLVAVHPILSLKWGNGWRYRRARLLREGEIPTTVDDLIWKKGVPAKMGRANPKGFQVLYLADRRDTAFVEVNAKNNRILLVDFEILSDQMVQVAPIGEMANIQRTGRGYFSGSESSFLSNFINACSKDEATSMLIADSFLLECLSDRNYEISSSVAKSVFDKLGSVSAIAYPSCRQLGAVNFAVRTEGFWKKWGVRAAREGHAQHLAQGYYQFSKIKNVIGISIKGRLLWGGEFGADETTVLLEPLWTPTE